jgi:hypothetical protein
MKIFLKEIESDQVRILNAKAFCQENRTTNNFHYHISLVNIISIDAISLIEQRSPGIQGCSPFISIRGRYDEKKIPPIGF